MSTIDGPPGGDPPPPPPPDGPPPSPPDGPPPGGPPTTAAGASPTPDWVKPAAIAAVLAVLVAIIVAVSGGDDQTVETATSATATTGSSTSTTLSGPGEIFLQPVSHSGPDPFGANAATPLPPDAQLPAPPTTPPPSPPPESGGSGGGGATAITATSGATPGLYGGTRDQSRCDKQQMIDYLVANPAKAQAFADVPGIPADQVPAYVDRLLPVNLLSDTRVTNHGFKDGRANAFQAVLQAGTAVLVDEYGTPRVRCACGNPLLPPIAIPTGPVYRGDPWTGFSPGSVTVIQPSTTVINVIQIIDIVDKTTINITINTNAPTTTMAPTPTVTQATPPTARATPTTPRPTPTTPRPTPTAPRTAPPTAPPTQPACPGQPGALLQRLTQNSASSSGPSSDTFPAGCGYRVVVNGEADLNINNTFAGGWDAQYCYDPQYCAPMRLGESFLINGTAPHQTFGVSAPPYDPSHVYSYTMSSLPGSRLTLSWYDVAYGDNVGSLTVDIYRA